jgi:hypothetical protein
MRWLVLALLFSACAGALSQRTDPAHDPAHPQAEEPRPPPLPNIVADDKLLAPPDGGAR